MAFSLIDCGGGMSTEKSPSGISGKPYMLAVTTATWWQRTPSGGAMTKAKTSFFGH